jgi:polo-like kinase 1
LTVQEIEKHPWLKSEVTVPERLPDYTLVRPPTLEFIAQCIPKRLGGDGRDYRSAKDYDKNLVAYARNMKVGKPLVKHMPGPHDGDANNLTQMQEHEDKVLNSQIRAYQRLQLQDLFADDQQYRHQDRPEVYVKSWVDYSAKYGLGYVLSNGSLGITFNDRSKLILDADCFHFSFFLKNQDNVDLPDKKCPHCHTFAKYPDELDSKVRLLQHFWSYFDGTDRYKNLLKKALERY